jgi:hypothetical protein
VEEDHDMIGGAEAMPVNGIRNKVDMDIKKNKIYIYIF